MDSNAVTHLGCDTALVSTAHYTFYSVVIQCSTEHTISNMDTRSKLMSSCTQKARSDSSMRELLIQFKIIAYV